MLHEPKGGLLHFMRNICKELRLKNNLTQEELANKIDVTRQTIMRWENNPDAIPIKSMVKVLIVEAEGKI